ncbi:hypothetical protein [Halomonas mongoliensis]|uniref:hypothetical protein n=1 Tax=Halomonas mongoliensis TaxID=321265 RepID=UPI00403A9F3C
MRHLRLALTRDSGINEATAFTMGSHFPLQPQDVVYVTTTSLACWNGVISLLLSSVRLPGATADIISDARGL